MDNLGFTELEERLTKEAINSGHPVYITKEKESVMLPLRKWQTSGRPHVVSVVARRENYTAVLDTGYGRLTLIDTKTQEASSTNQHVATLNNAVMLDAEYFGTEHWLYIAERESNAPIHADNDAGPKGVASD